MEFAESVLLPAAEQFAMVTDINHRDEDRLLHFFVGCDVSIGGSEIICAKRTLLSLCYKDQLTVLFQIQRSPSES